MADETPQGEWATEAETAHHEAGHHVAFRHLRPEVPEADAGELSIIPNTTIGSVGHHATPGAGPGPRPAAATGAFDRQEVEDYIVEVYAGGAAGLRFDPRSRSALWHLSDPTLEEGTGGRRIRGRSPWEAPIGTRRKPGSLASRRIARSEPS